MSIGQFLQISFSAGVGLEPSHGESFGFGFEMQCAMPAPAVEYQQHDRAMYMNLSSRVCVP
jgi:hypothetical protein